MKANQKNFLLEESAEKFGSSTAIRTSETVISYSDLYLLTRNISDALLRTGFSKGERIAILSENSIEYILMLFAVFRIGGIAVPVNVHQSEISQIDVLKDIKCDRLIVSDRYISPGYSKYIKVYNTSEIAGKNKVDETQTEKYFDHAQDNDATIFLTSGSTSNPKAVLHTLESHIQSSLSSNRNIHFNPGDTWLLSLPLYHVGGMSIIFRAVTGGGTVVVQDPGEDPADSIDKHVISHISLVPTQLYRLLGRKKNIPILRKMKAIVLGGGAIPEHLINSILEFDLPVYASYGSTEMASQVATSRITTEWGEKSGGIKVLDHCRIKIADDGEILIKSVSLLKGYIIEGKLESAVDDDGWYHSGDAGSIDDTGKLRYSCRIDNMFISGGENIYPENIERELCRFKGIIEAVAVPIPDVEYGYRAAAFVKIEEGMRIIHEELKTFLRESLPGLMVPEFFFNLPNDYKTGIKPDRKKLKKIAADIIGKR